MRWFTRPCMTMVAIAGVLSLAACSPQRAGTADRDLSMMSHPSLYRGALYHPHPRGLTMRQAEIELAAGVPYKGCVAIVSVSLRDADAGRGIDCSGGGRIAFDAGVRYGDCTVLRPITLTEAERGGGLLCDTETTEMRAALEDLRLRVARR